MQYVLVDKETLLILNGMCEALALQAFKRTLQDPDFYLSNWNGNNPCESGWNGVFCSPPTGPSNITYVIEL